MSLRRRRIQGAVYKVEIPLEVADIIRRLPPEVKYQIKQAFLRLAEFPEAGKPLTGELAGFHSDRTRRFRIVYRLTTSGQRLLILHVGPRRTVYEELTEKSGSNPHQLHCLL